MVNYVGPAPFVIKTVKGDLMVMTDIMEFNGNTIGSCMTCEAESPLSQWVYEHGIGDRRLYREPGAAKELESLSHPHWFEEE